MRRRHRSMAREGTVGTRRAREVLEGSGVVQGREADDHLRTARRAARMEEALLGRRTNGRNAYTATSLTPYHLHRSVWS